jgi:FixJ family two-component response regulator
MSVRAIKPALRILTKPIRHQDLMDGIRVAIEGDRQQRAKNKWLIIIRY